MGGRSQSTPAAGYGAPELPEGFRQLPLGRPGANWSQRELGWIHPDADTSCRHPLAKGEVEFYTSLRKDRGASTSHKPHRSPAGSGCCLSLIPWVQIPGGSRHGATSPKRGSRQSLWGGQSVPWPSQCHRWNPASRSQHGRTPTRARAGQTVGKGGPAPSAAPAPSRLSPANSWSSSTSSCFCRVDD